MRRPIFCSGGLLLLAMPACTQGVIGTYAGTEFLFPANRLLSRTAPVGAVQDVALDPAGNVYIADRDNHVVLSAATDASLIVIAGNGLIGFSGDQGQAVNASLRSPQGLAIDGSGNLFISDVADQRVRKVAPDGTISTVSGTGTAGFSGDGPATANQLNQPRGLAVDGAGNLYIADTANNRLRMVTPGGLMTTVAGTGRASNSGDGGPANAASLNSPSAVKVDSAGNIYIATLGSIRKIAPNNTISTVFAASNPAGLAIDSRNNVYIADGSSQVVLRVTSGGSGTVLVGTSGTAGFSGDGFPATTATLNSPGGLAIDAGGVLFIADRGNLRVRRVGTDGIISTYAGSGNYRFSGDGQLAISAAMRQPVGIATDALGDIFIADLGNNRIRQITTDGLINTVAGNGAFTFAGDGGTATNASLAGPEGVAVDLSGFYIADRSNNRVRKVDLARIIRTFAGGGAVFGGMGDGGPANQAQLRFPFAVALDGLGNVYIADTNDDIIRRVGLDGNITTVAGGGFSTADGVPATNASLSAPQGIAVDAQNRLYIADTDDNLIRMVANGKITTIAGGGNATGENVAATSALVNSPRGLALDAAGNLYYAEANANRVRRISNGVVSTVAGMLGPGGFFGDGGLAVNALLSAPTGLAFDAAGNLYIADSNNNRIRKVFAAPPKVQISPTTLSFSGITGGLRTAPRLVSISSNDLSGLPFKATLLNNSPWLTVFPLSGPIPATLEISADPSGLKAGSYQETIHIATDNALPASTDITVQFNVSDPGQPSQSVQPQVLTFAFVAGSSPKSQALTVANLGGGTLSFTAASNSPAAASNFLAVSPASGTATPSHPVTLTVTANPGQLPPGTYTGSITIALSIGQPTVVPVTMTITNTPQIIQLSQTGLTFTAVAGGGVVPPQSFSVLNSGQVSTEPMNWTVNVPPPPGGQRQFLSLSPLAGTSIAGSANIPSVTVTADATGLQPGEYFNEIEVDSKTALNSPQFIPVVLEVLDPGQDPGPNIQPSQLVFTGVAGTPPPGSQNLLIYNLKGASLNYRSQSTTLSSPNWITYLPTEAAVDPTSPTRLVVQPDTTKLLNPTVEQGVLSLSFNDGSTRKINILTVVLPKAPGSSDNSLSAAQAPCTATDLVPSLTVLGQGFTVPAGTPNRLVVNVLDTCGRPMADGRVSVSFSNGDSPLPLLSLQDGNWSATWNSSQPAGPVTLTVTVESPARGLKKSVDVTGTTRLTIAAPPRISSGGVVNGANFALGQPLAPGDIISIFGTGLANGANAATKLPLDTTLAGATATIAGVQLPLFYASPDQVNAVLPYSLNVNTSYQLLVTQGNLVSGAEPIVIAPAQPGVILTKAGPAVLGPNGLLSTTNPARAGDVLSIYAIGLGPVQGTVAFGAASSALPTASPATVSIGNVNAAVLYAGLAPTFVGLYQINAMVPTGLQSGGQVLLTVSILGQTSPPVPIPVR